MGFTQISKSIVLNIVSISKENLQRESNELLCAASMNLILHNPIFCISVYWQGPRSYHVSIQSPSNRVVGKYNTIGKAYFPIFTISSTTMCTSLSYPISLGYTVQDTVEEHAQAWPFLVALNSNISHLERAPEQTPERVEGESQRGSIQPNKLPTIAWNLLRSVVPRGGLGEKPRSNLTWSSYGGLNSDNMETKENLPYFRQSSQTLMQ